MSFPSPLQTSFIVLFILVLSFSSNAQQLPDSVSNNLSDVEGEVHSKVEQMPEYPGGQGVLLEYIGSISYPRKAKKNEIEGTIYIEFIVNKEGEVVDVVPVEGTETGTILDTAAVDHIREMKDWKPGYQDGEPVKVRYVVPINFEL